KYNKKAPDGQELLKLTNYKPKLNERSCRGRSRTFKEWLALLINQPEFPYSPPPGQGGVSASFTTLQYSCIYLSNADANIKRPIQYCKLFNKISLKIFFSQPNKLIVSKLKIK